MKTNKIEQAAEAICQSVNTFVLDTMQQISEINKQKEKSRPEAYKINFKRKDTRIMNQQHQPVLLENGKLSLVLEGIIAADDSGAISVKGLRQILSRYDDIKELEITLSTIGGDLFEGIAFKNFISSLSFPTTIIVSELVASAGSVAILGADTIKMTKGSELMVHNPWTIAKGNSKQLRKVASDLEKAQSSIEESYLSRFNKSRKTLKALLDAETWLTPEQALDFGLVDSIV